MAVTRDLEQDGRGLFSENYMACNNSVQPMSTWIGYLVSLNELWRGHGSEPTPSEFADYCRVPLGRAKVALLRLSRMGMARRRKDRGAGRTKPPFRYRPSKRGALEASMRGTDPDVADELHQIEQIDELEGLVEAGQFSSANQFYVTRRKGWSFVWRHAARLLLLKLYTNRDRARREELVAAVQEIMKPLEGMARALESRQNVSDRASWHEGHSPREPRALSQPRDRSLSSSHSCDISSHLPPNLRWRTSHIVLDPAINPITGEFLLDHENRPVYNQVYEPWEPGRATEAAAADAATALACGVIVGVLQAAVPRAAYQARVATLEAEVRSMRSRLSSKTAEARIFEEVHHLDLAWIGQMRELERSLSEDRVTSQANLPHSGAANALLVTESLALVSTTMEKAEARLDRYSVMIPAFANILARLLEREASRRR